MDFEKITKYLTDESTREEKEELREWINQNDKNKLNFNQIKHIWETSSTLRPFDYIDPSHDWEYLKPNLRSRYKTHSKKIPTWNYLAKVAVILIFAISFAYGLYKLSSIVSKPRK